MDIYEIRQALGGGKTIYDLPLRVTFYARVSTEKEEQLHSLSAQVRYYQDLIGNCPKWTLVPGYVDEGISGTSVRKRESFLRMMEDARAHRFDFIVTKEISRFSRSTLDSIQYTQELLRCGIGVLFQSDNINTLFPDSELRLTIMSSVAQEEVRKISERVRFGFGRAIEHGVVLGSNRIWGYRKDSGRLVIVPEEAEMVQLIFDLYANQQMGIRAIASHLTNEGYRNTNGNPFSFSTIRGILSNPKYKGYYCGGKSTKIDYKLTAVKRFSPEEWVTYQDPDHVPPIVSEALWEKANALLRERAAKQRSGTPSSYQNKYPYSGKILCGVHHTPYYRSLYRCKTGNREVWQCREYTKSGRRGCQSPSLYSDEITMILLDSMSDILPQKEALLQELLSLYSAAGKNRKLETALAQCQESLRAVRRRKDRLLDLNLEGQITNEEFRVRNDQFNSVLEEQEERQTALREQLCRKPTERVSFDVLKEAIRKELSFPEGFTIGVADALLDHVQVLGTDDRSVVKVEVFFKVTPTKSTYLIHRKRGGPSLCSRVSI